MENCYSPQVLNFFQNKNITFVEQKGNENFTSYHSEENPRAKPDVLPISAIDKEIREPKYKMIGGELKNVNLYFRSMREPDWLKKLNLQMQESLLDLKKNNTSLGILKSEDLSKKIIIGLKENLKSPNNQPYLAEHINNIRNVKIHNWKRD